MEFLNKRGIRIASIICLGISLPVLAVLFTAMVIGQTVVTISGDRINAELARRLPIAAGAHGEMRRIEIMLMDGNGFRARIGADLAQPVTGAIDLTVAGKFFFAEGNITLTSLDIEEASIAFGGDAPLPADANGLRLLRSQMAKRLENRPIPIVRGGFLMRQAAAAITSIETKPGQALVTLDIREPAMRLWPFAVVLLSLSIYPPVLRNHLKKGGGPAG